MSTNKTPNYQLHSWTSTDHFRFHEVNENFTLLDAALKREADTLAAALEPRLRVCVGSYTGSSASNHTLSQRIALGFRPKALLFGFDRAPAAVHISIEAGTDSGIFIGDSGSKYGVTVDDTGFSLVAQCFNNVTRYYTYAAYFL